MNDDILERMNVVERLLIFKSTVGPTIQIKRVGASCSYPASPSHSPRSKAEGTVMINLTFSHTTSNATKGPAKLQKPPS